MPATLQNPEKDTLRNGVPRYAGTLACAGLHASIYKTLKDMHFDK